jgi:hypothetical protein
VPGGGYVPAGSPSISTPISRRNSNTNTSHPSSPSTSITNTLGATTITASPFIHNKTPHYSTHTQNIQNSPLQMQPTSPAPNNMNHSFNINNNQNNNNNQNGQNQYTNGNSQTNNRKNSTTSLNSAQMSLIAQFQQNQAPPSPMQHHQSQNQNINNAGNLFNQPLLMNQPLPFGSNSNNHMQQNQVPQQFGSNDPYAYQLNKHQILQEIYNLTNNNNDINVYNKD